MDIVCGFGREGSEWALRPTLVETTMPRHLPPEILDLIVDCLHDEPTTLKACCLASKSLVPRSRRHIFARVEFDSARSSIESWTRAFPDPSNSPAHYTLRLYIHDPEVFSTNVSTWIGSFHRVQELVVNTLMWGGPRMVSFVQLHGLSPTLKSLRVSSLTISISEIFGLICSFPLLEELSLHSHRESDADGWVIPPTSPKLTRSLRLRGRNSSIIRELLNLPGGLHFTKIRVRCDVRDVDPRAIMDLVSKCSDTLESLCFRYYPLRAFPLVYRVAQSLTVGPVISRTPPVLDLSNATKLKYLEFRWGRCNVRWMTMTLHTVQLRDLRRITIFLHNIMSDPTEEKLQEWHELDHLLVQLWASHSILPRVLYKNAREGLLTRLLPELTSGGFVCKEGER